MKYKNQLILNILSFLLIIGCASETVKYDLPSVKETVQPEWIESADTAGDTIFVVVNLQVEKSDDMSQSVQQAKSELHNILAGELEAAIRESWEYPKARYSETEKFQMLSDLPIAMERTMNHVVVSDGWDKNGEVSILCALDYSHIAMGLKDDLRLKDDSVLDNLKQRLNAMTKK